MDICMLCPRKCGVNRQTHTGICGGSSEIKIARAAPHFWEEPCISGEKGSGAIFFSGCTLRCVYCQNYEISRGGKGDFVTPEGFEKILFSLKEQGVHNINLVTADHYVKELVPLLRGVKGALALPIVFNCSGYESEEMLSLLAGVVDVYLADFKYADNALGMKYSHVPDYADVAKKALVTMFSQVGRPVYNANGMLQKGLIVRHLVLPGERQSSLATLGSLATLFQPEDFVLSLMSQYTPNGKAGAPDRRLTTFEYNSCAKEAEKYGFRGYFQEFSSQSQAFTPPFDGEGVTK